jgi:beta-glucosidase
MGKEDTMFHPQYKYPFQNPNLPVKERVNNILSLLTLEEKISIFGGHPQYGSMVYPAIIRLGIQESRRMSEALHGVAWFGQATVFPASLGLSQSWDRDLIWRIGHAIGLELYSKGNVAPLTPVVDLLRDPRYGRAYETMGEDAVLTGNLATAMALGINSRTSNGYQLGLPIMKHFFAYNNEINRVWTNSVLTQRNMNEYYFKVFKEPISAGAAKAVMVSYPLVNGKPMMVNPVVTEELLKKWVPEYPDSGKDEFFIITDFRNPVNLYMHNQRFYRDDIEGRALSAADAVRNGIAGFTDVNKFVFPAIYDAVARGILKTEEIDKTIRQVFTTRMRVGDFDHFDSISPYTRAGAYDTTDLAIEKHKALALEAGQKQIVLLKNEGILPLKGGVVKEVVLLGLLGDDILRDHYSPNYSYKVSIKTALENKLGEANVYFARAVDTIAFKASNGQYLVNPDSKYKDVMKRSPLDATPDSDRILACGGGKVPVMSEKEKLYELYDYGSNYNLLRTPINDLFVQYSHDDKFVNNAASPGSGCSVYTGLGYMQPLCFTGHQNFSLLKLKDEKTALYSYVAGNGGLEWDRDDEDMNNGSFMAYNAEDDRIVALGGPGPLDTEERLNALKAEHKFEMSVIRSKQEAIDETLKGASKDAPVMVVLGYEPHLNAREAVDLYKTGLSDGQMEVIIHITKKLNRDVILILKAGSPMIVTEEVQNNPRVKAIVYMGPSCQEEGAALVSTLFEDGYEGKTPGYEGHIPMNAPAGRLSTTWYKKISDIPGAGSRYPPASYRYPKYDEQSNDNLSKLNGSIPAGILIYDIIKGKRTYQYFEEKALYPFGYGLTYVRFDYSGLKVEGHSEKDISLSVQVRNTGNCVSDEVVQFYGFYDLKQGRRPKYEQARKRLLGFERVRNLGPGEQRTVELRVDTRDKLGVWDAGARQLWVEPGRYVIQAGRSSDDRDAVEIEVEIRGEEKALRKINGEITAADSFDDYSHLGKLEIIHCPYDGGNAVKLEADKSWIKFMDGDFRGKPKIFTALVSAERDTELSLYAGKPGDGGKCIKTIRVQDTRSIKTVDPGLGIGPGMSRDDPAFTNKPGWIKVCEEISGFEGIEDLYLESSRRGFGIGWFKFGDAKDKTAGIRFTPKSRVYSIRVKRGELSMHAELIPKTSMDRVKWSVSGIDGRTTELGEIDGEGVLKAAGKGNGTVVVKAESNNKTASAEILITNQEESNKYTDGDKKVSIDYLLFQTGVHITDSIIRKQGMLQNTLYYRAPEKEYDFVSYDILPAEEVEWTVRAEDGSPASIAVIDGKGLLRATGTGDGKVKVKAVYKRNPDIYGERVIAIGNQGPKDAYSLIQGEHYDWRTAYPEPKEYLGPTPDTGSTFGPGSNEMGLYVAAKSGDLLRYENVDFGRGAQKFVIRLSGNEYVTISVWADGKNAASGGILLGTLQNIMTGGKMVYKTWMTDVVRIEGKHDLYLAVNGKDETRINWFQFLPL